VVKNLTLKGLSLKRSKKFSLAFCALSLFLCGQQTNIWRFGHHAGLDFSSASRYTNGTDLWVLTHQLGNNTFQKFLVSASGISALTVATEQTLLHW
jgi:hypothetical protein